MKKRRQFGTGGRVIALGIVLSAAGALWLFGTLVQQIRINESSRAQQSVMLSGTAITNPEVAGPYMDPASGGAAEDRISTEKVLFLSSYDPTAVYYEDQVLGMLSAGDACGIEFDVINMDFLKHHTNQDYADLTRSVESRLGGGDYRGVLVADDEALGFVMDHRDDIFAGLPVIFYGVENAAMAKEAAEDPNTTGYLEDTNIRDTVDLALSLLPDTKQVAAIYDESLTGLAEGEDFQSLGREPRYSGITFTPIDCSQYTDEELKQQAASYGDGTVILLLTAHGDLDDNYLTSAEMTGMVAQASSVPVFRNGKGGYSSGVVAGKITSFETAAADAVSLMHQVLDGSLFLSSVSLQPSPEDGGYVASYDGMEKFGLSLRALPADTIVIGAPMTIRSQYGQLFPPSLLVVSGLLMIVLGSQIEVRKRKHAEGALRATADQLRTAGEHDFLTGILTRQEALHRLQGMSEEKQSYGLVLSDMDGFKEVNETYGHEEGDRLLQEIAAELQSLAKKYGGKIARYGGDEFMIWIAGRQIQEGDPLLADILQVFRTDRTAGIGSGRICASVGAANSLAGETPRDVILCAEAAVSRVKAAGKNGCLIFTQEMKQEEIFAEKKKEEILAAIHGDGFRMVYQPQVDLRTGKLVGFEALVRMKSGAMGPAEFIPIAEKNGWIQQIGRLTTKMTIRQIHAWREAGLTPPPISINYSAGQLDDTGYEDYLQDLLARYGVPASAVHLEITESLFIQNWEEASSFFDRIRKRSLHLVMDDFGTGYSSLSYLARIPVDVVKIDRALLLNYSGGKRDSFLADVIGLVHDVGKGALCEGAETKEEVALLQSLSCDYIQGYYFGKPGSAEEAAAQMLRETLDPEKSEDEAKAAGTKPWG